jgi:hypothetical protein
MAGHGNGQPSWWQQLQLTPETHQTLQQQQQQLQQQQQQQQQQQLGQSPWTSPAPVVPAWQLVEGAAHSQPGHGSSGLLQELEAAPAKLLADLARAPLPCLRFFLRAATDIRDAYVPPQYLSGLMQQ